MVTLGVLMLLVFFSTIIYYVEQMSSDTQFESIPDAMWYAAVTITSLGYGDMVPSTMLGKLCGVATILTGFLGSSLLIPIVQMKFGNISKG
ncbi:potassium voltage-gated channel subfamily A member 2 isoform X2 [Nematostella vectensis]|nr:potassium voltage-gated channel subfamily A member 2 isoform X2 [Nematostella vectensis]